ncbi:hypothetical protein EJ06DRAFT_529619 [Trichodelitschia bisporula]|uniref:ferric-chelate reductase (NADPH) n=1 Tax=Trichodelitschia bisporula TaxID=703511 RepID=A0A6G1I0B0_9PEZI|nr:hypothetical protein EJ06DRAFT_529619 [Trichodelitschia bisporula]
MADYAGDQSENTLWNLPIEDPRCMNRSCKAFIIGWNDSQNAYSNTFFESYGEWAVWFYAVLIGLFMIIHFRHRLNDFHRRSNLQHRLVGYWRSFTYRRLSGKLGDSLDISYGVLLLMAAATIYISILPFFQGKYLRSEFRYGSPPLSVRCAMLMSGLTPVCIALAGKVNVVTFLTGISYAKLNIWHRFVAYILFCLSIIHAVPHIIAPLKEGGWNELVLLYRLHRRELPGTFLQAVFILLVIFSLPYFRNKAYEVFKHLHIFFAAGWFALMFWHIKGEYAAPEYIYGAMALWAFSVIARMIQRNRFTFPLSRGLHGFPTALESLPGDMTRVTVTVPARLRWRPGQHCYISIPGISAMDNHPFTIASVPTPRYLGGQNEMVFLVRACGGFTRKLNKLAKRREEQGLSNLSGLTVNGRSTPMMSVTDFDEPPRARHDSYSSLSRLKSENPSRASFTSTTKPRVVSTLSTAPLSPYRYSGRTTPTSPGFPSLEALESLRANTADVGTWIDGPFGDYVRPAQHYFDGFVTVAGGSGVTASLPWLVYLSEKIAAASALGPMPGAGKEADGFAADIERERACRTRSVRFVWSIRKAAWIAWARPEIVRALRALADLPSSTECRVEVLIYVTSKEEADGQQGRSAELELLMAAGMVGAGAAKATGERVKVEVRFGRPDMKNLLPGFMVPGGRNLVTVCGPNALKIGVANEVARLQGMAVSGAVEDITLHSETFGW